MTVVGLACGLLTAISLTVALRSRRIQHRRMEAVTRACHELRGPLTALGFAVTLAARDDGLAPARVSAIETELQRASLALEDLAGARRATTASRVLGAVSMAGLLDDVLASATGLAWSAGVELAGGWEGPDVIVCGERVRLAQALGNVVANAVEHGGGRVRVRGGRRDGDHVGVEVSDEGTGLPAPLSTLARRARGGQGARGRGLAIASAIADEHGGRLMTAPSSRGALVVLTLPARDAVAASGG